VVLTQTQLASAVADRRAVIIRVEAKRVVYELEHVVLEELGNCAEDADRPPVQLTVRVKRAQKGAEGSAPGGGRGDDDRGQASERRCVAVRWRGRRPRCRARGKRAGRESWFLSLDDGPDAGALRDRLAEAIAGLQPHPPR